MSREMRVFVSLVVVWLFSITGANGKLTTKPDNFVVVKGSEATLFCATDEDTVQWFSIDYLTESEDEVGVIDNTCRPTSSISYIEASGSPNACTLTAKDTKDNLTYMYSCQDTDTIGRGIVMFIESPLKCGIEDNKYTCLMANSAYKNDSEITLRPFISSRLIWRDDGGNIVGTQYTNFQNPGTIVTAGIPDGASKDSPHVCSADFKFEGDLGVRYSPIINIVPDGKLECRYPSTAEHEQAAQGAAAKEAAKQAGSNKTSNANLERDGVDAIAMLLSLMAAFLVY